MTKLWLNPPHRRRIGLLFALLASLTLVLMGGCGNSLLGIPIGSTPAPDVTIKLTADPVAVPATAAAIPADATSCTITWTTDYSGTCYLEWGTATGSYPNTTAPESNAASSHSATIGGLAWGTTYYYRIRSASAGNGISTSSENTFTTATISTATIGQRMRGIWIVGGLNGPLVSSNVASVDLFDPVTGTWYPAITTLPTPVSFAGYAGSNGVLYVIGGYTSGGVAQALVQIYTVASGVWTSGNAMTAPRANIYATVSNGKIYVMGGTASTAPTAYAAVGGTTTNYEYNISGNNWTSPVPLAYAAAINSERFTFAFNDVIYNLGGRNAAASVAASAHDAYIPVGNVLSTSTTETAMATARSGVAGALSVPSSGPAAVILVGGVSTFTGNTGCFVNVGTTTPTLSNLVQQLAYPFSVAAWWKIPTSGDLTYPTAIAFGAAAISRSFNPERFYYFGGVSSLGTVFTLTAGANWCNVPATSGTTTTWNGTWTAITNMPNTPTPGRWGHGAVTVQ